MSAEQVPGFLSLVSLVALLLLLCLTTPPPNRFYDPEEDE